MHFRFAILSDPHITLPETLEDYPGRAPLYEVSQSALSAVLEHLQICDLDFLLIPGDLTQNSEQVNHAWLRETLEKLPFPTYVIAGNHDARTWESSPELLGLKDFPSFYRQFGYDDSEGLDYEREILPGVRLIGLNSNVIEGSKVLGRLDQAQLTWVASRLAAHPEAIWLVMVHHNLLEHLPFQRLNPILSNYILPTDALVEVLKGYSAMVFTGHLHVQDIAQQGNLYEITTGSLVSYPHPYRILNWEDGKLQVETHHIKNLPDWPELQKVTLERMAQGSHHYMIRWLSGALEIPQTQAAQYSEHLRYFWATIAAGDAQFSFAHLPENVQAFMAQFNDQPPADNDAVLPLGLQGSSEDLPPRTMKDISVT
ncbi:MAG: metallophosphoesterase [Anaerolineae bacterium]|nr:metallophosphoesterase [Gloeobacterales cyanobacterium ES-bin-313]